MLGLNPKEIQNVQKLKRKGKKNENWRGMVFVLHNRRIWKEEMDGCWKVVIIYYFMFFWFCILLNKKKECIIIFNFFLRGCNCERGSCCGEMNLLLYSSYKT